MSNTFYVNLFHNGCLKFSGFKKRLENADGGGKRPVMLPVGTGISKGVTRTAKRFPYALDEKKNIRRFGSGGFDIAFLVPTRDVKNLTDTEFEESLWYKLTGSETGRLEELEETLDEKEDTIGKLKKQLRELREEEEEQNKGGTGRSSSGMLRCSSCRQSSSESQWKRNGGMCPNCNAVTMDDPDVIRE